MARAYLPCAAAKSRHRRTRGARLAAIVHRDLDRALLRGAFDREIVGLTMFACRGRSLLLRRCQAAAGHRMVLRSWRCPALLAASSAGRGETFFAESGRQDFGQQAVRRPAVSLRTARQLLPAVSGFTLLAGLNACWPWLTPVVYAARREPKTKFLLARRCRRDRVRAGGDQAAALRVPLYSCDRDPYRRRGRCADAVAQASSWCGE